VSDRIYSVYIITNQSNTTLYTGVTGQLKTRLWQHKSKAVEGFTKKYNVNKLVYYEVAENPESAISREKQIKNLVRRKKINLIEKDNPEWRDLYDEL